VREYNKMFGFDLNTTFLSKNYREKKRKKIIETKAYKNLEKGKAHRFKAGEGPKDPHYKRSEQTKKRLRVLRTKKHAKGS